MDKLQQYEDSDFEEEPEDEIEPDSFDWSDRDDTPEPETMIDNEGNYI